jgi:hypothetical protein
MSERFIKNFGLAGILLRRLFEVGVLIVSIIVIAAVALVVHPIALLRSPLK